MIASLLLHILVVVLVLLLAPSPANLIPARDKPLNKRNRILLQPVPRPSEGGGGGGSDSVTPPSRGRLPRYALRQFTPPVVVPPAFDPKLTVEPTIVLEATATHTLPNSPIGLPSGLPGPPSGGSGRRGGIGEGERGGVGNGAGSRMEGMAVDPVRSGMKAPTVLFKTEPEYSEQARKARVQGTIVVECVIDERGLPHMPRVRDGLGFGLDEQALEAVKLWKFRPATRDGKPVSIVGTFYLTFRLL